MAWELPVALVPFKAGEDLSTSQFCVVGLNARGEIVRAAHNAPAVGVLQDAPLAGQAGSVMTFGISKVKAAAAITVGQRLSAYTDGSGAVAPATSGSFVIGIALESATAAGQVITALVFPGFYALP
ncbi:MAG: DUF2190 family protein [Thermofilaceae archaeon]